MNLRRHGMFLIALVFLLTLPLLPATAPQRQERRVFTNEDIKRPSPQPPVTEPAAPAQPAPGTPSATPPTPAPPESGPQAALKRALEYQAVFRNAQEEYSAKMEQETDEALKLRWLEMSTCLSKLIGENQRTISELQAQIKQLESAAAPAPPQ